MLAEQTRVIYRHTNDPQSRYRVPLLYVTPSAHSLAHKANTQVWHKSKVFIGIMESEQQWS